VEERKVEVMIETTNPEIDVTELMKRVRAEASKIAQRPRRSRAIAPEGGAPALPPIPVLPPMPAVWIPRPGNPKKERLDELLQNARKKTEVSSIIPKFLRGLFRKQGSYNRCVLESISVLAKSNFELNKKVREISTCLEQLNGWMLALTQHREADANWMTAATPQITQIAALDAELESAQSSLQTQGAELDERMARTEAHGAALLDQLKQMGVQFDEVHAQANSVAELTRDLQQHLKNLQGQADAMGAEVNNLPGALAHLKDLQAQTDAMGAEVNNLPGALAHLKDLQAQADATGAQVKNLPGALVHLKDLQAQADRLGVHINNLQGFVDQRIGDDAGLTQKVARLEDDATFIKGELSERSSLLERALGGDQTAATGKPRRANDVRDNKSVRALDSFYLRFENRFRGSPTEIKKRVRFYLPFLASVDAGIAGRPVLDLGCGRGEWLELLKENKLKARGVDMNSAMIAQCKERSLDVIRGDAIEYMRSLRANSQGGVTGFHIIEHLPFETLMEFFGEARRVLKPGGIAIFESPNCKNLVVGATNFNIDPTHRNPVFPETAELMLQSHGFERVRIEYLSPVTDVKFDDSTKELATLKKMLYGPQDFGVIAYKPKAR
jgi:SAM-dependent methyltransferase